MRMIVTISKNELENGKYVFVFGSNRAGRHGAGAALDAVRFYGAVRGRGEGCYGNSYALPTKNYFLNTLSLPDISKNVTKFIDFAYNHPEFNFYVTRIGCGLAGYQDFEIAPMFVKAPTNCYFHREWAFYLPNGFVYY